MYPTGIAVACVFDFAYVLIHKELHVESNVSTCIEQTQQAALRWDHSTAY